MRSSGVIGVDEKWVLVPKNNKPEGKRKRWMYAYLAVDVYTYDLLHIDIYPYNGKNEARAFLQALKAKGYQPQVIITDMNQDYDEPVRVVFPQATHHECVFHALQWAQRRIKEVYGSDYARTHPEAVDLKDKIYRIFKAKSKKTVHKRYQKVMALKEEYITRTPEAECIFGFLERHYPKLVNAVENPLIPLTNNTVEWVTLAPALQVRVSTALTSTTRICVALTALTRHASTYACSNCPTGSRLSPKTIDR